MGRAVYGRPVCTVRQRGPWERSQVLLDKSWAPKQGVMPHNGGHPTSVLDALVFVLPAAAARRCDAVSL